MVSIDVRNGFLAMVLLLVGCDGPYAQSLKAKQPYSVLQSEEYALRQSPRRYRYVFKRRAHGTKYDTLALPTKSGDGNYVVMIANASEPNEVLTVPGDEVDQPRITRVILQELVLRGMLSDSSRRYLATRAPNR